MDEGHDKEGAPTATTAPSELVTVRHRHTEARMQQRASRQHARAYKTDPDPRASVTSADSKTLP